MNDRSDEDARRERAELTDAEAFDMTHQYGGCPYAEQGMECPWGCDDFEPGRAS